MSRKPEKEEAMDNRNAPLRSLLSKPIILEHIKEGNIFIDPFNANDLRTTSYDVRLGENYFQEQPFRALHRRVLNPFDKEHIERYWGNPQKATVTADWIAENGPLKNIKPEDNVIIVGPGECILAHTQEFIGGKNCVTTEMRARSSMVRIGITVCKCAGWGDLGFCNRWTMEVSNHLKDTSVVLVVGMRVAQIAFYQVDPLDESYYLSGEQYQNTDDTKKMIKTWSPYLMLPKFNRDNY